MGARVQVPIVTMPSYNLVQMTAPPPPDGDGQRAELSFDACFGGACTQQQLYEEVSPAVASVLSGQYVCVMAYGQTGAGKTFTMQGAADEPGLVHLATDEVRDMAADNPTGRSRSSPPPALAWCSVRVSASLAPSSLPPALARVPRRQLLRVTAILRGITADGAPLSDADDSQLIAAGCFRSCCGRRRCSSASTRSAVSRSRSSLAAQCSKSTTRRCALDVMGGLDAP